MMKWLAFLLLGLALRDGAMVHIQVLEGEGKPMPGVRVALVLYDLRGTTAYEVHIGACVTGTTGRCSISIPENAPRDLSGMYRGALIIGDYGRRSVLWMGDEFQVVVNVNHLNEGRESAPLPGEEWGVGLQVKPGWHRLLPWIWFGLALLFLGLGWWYRREQ